MAYIKEPEGVDFLIQSSPLTDQERKEISEFIKKIKTESSRERVSRKRKVKKEMAE